MKRVCKNCKYGKILGSKKECYRIFCNLKREEIGLYNQCNYYQPKWWIFWQYKTKTHKVTKNYKCIKCGLEVLIVKNENRNMPMAECEICNEMTLREIQEEDEKYKKLKDALTKYCKHLPDCALCQHHTGKVPCTCGLDKFLNET